MTVSAIRKLSSERYIVCFGEQEIKTTANVIAQFRLYEGRELSEGSLEEFSGESARALAREHALEILSRRQMSERELRQKLTEKGYDEATALYCCNWLTERHFLDDSEYCEALYIKRLRCRTDPFGVCQKRHI